MPDALFRKADAVDKRLRISRSELYARALTEFLNDEQADSVTERLNALYTRDPAKVDPGLHRAQLGTNRKYAW